MSLQQHSNLLAVYPLILERLKTVKGVKAVKEIGEMAELVAGSEKRKVAPLDGAVYVVWGGATLADTAKKSSQIRQTLHFTFVLAKNYVSGGKSNLPEVGAILTALQHTFSGWDAGSEYTLGEFARTASPSIEYNDGYALYPMSFTVDVATMPSEI